MRWRTIPSSAVTVNGRHPASVRSSHHVVQIALGPPKGVLCDSIGRGRVTVRFTSGAGLINPLHAGSYPVWLRTRGQTASGRLRIS